jgi:hypothetical protein
MRTIAVLCVALGLAPAAAAAPRGFHAGGVSCATGLRLRGLVCASPSLHSRPYDGRGLVQLLPSGRMHVPRSGSDVLLALDRASTHRLAGRAWRAAGYACAGLGGGVACVRAGHGFFLSARVFRRF